jgi:hypothetical protein
MRISIVDAIKILRPNSSFGTRGNNIIWNDPNNEQPTEEQIQAKIAELEAAEPMRLLRIERDRLIQQTDWWVLPDRTATPAQLSYRQALRDLPANSTPTLDENGQLTNIVWPEEP